MKTKYILGAVLFLIIHVSFSQTADIDDDIEWEAGNCPEHWTNWTLPGDCPDIIKFGQDGLQSVHISDEGTTDVVLDLGSKIFDDWYLFFWMYVPEGKEAYFSIQGQVPIDGGQWVVGNIFFNKEGINPGEGLIDDTAFGEVNFNFPHNEWFEVILNVDIMAGIGAATCWLEIDDIDVLAAGTPFTNEAGDVPTSLGGLDFSVLSPNTSFYIDNIYYYNPPLKDTPDFNKKLFKLFPNPTHNFINIESKDAILSIRVLSQLGEELINTNITNTIDVSHLASGLYFIEVETEAGKGMQKFIKQ